MPQRSAPRLAALVHVPRVALRQALVLVLAPAQVPVLAQVLVPETVQELVQALAPMAERDLQIVLRRAGDNGGRGSPGHLEEETACSVSTSSWTALERRSTRRGCTRHTNQPLASPLVSL